MSEPAKVFEESVIPGQWHVEWCDDDGHREVEIFTGPAAQRAMQGYGYFKEVQPEAAR